MIHDIHAFDAFSTGMKVVVHSLQTRVDLNEMEGTILATKNGKGRLTVRVGVEEVLVRSANLKPAFVSNGVRFRGQTDLKESVPVGINRTFVKCPIPHAIGIPLVAFLEAPTPNEPGDMSQYKGCFLMDDLTTGLAPIEWNYGGACGPMPWMQVARTDGEDFSVNDLEVLILYIMDRFNYGPTKVTSTDFEAFKADFYTPPQCTVGMSCMTDSELYAQIQQELTHHPCDMEIARERERELLERILDRSSPQLRCVETFPMLGFITTLTVTRSFEARRRAAMRIPCFKVLQEAYYAITNCIVSTEPNDMGRFAASMMRSELNKIFRGLHDWQS